jgi:hypothetical protein
MQPATIEMIKVIAAALGELNSRAVFVGGATVPFYLPEAYVSLARPRISMLSWRLLVVSLPLELLKE